jgi:hypothetical protein
VGMVNSHRRASDCESFVLVTCSCCHANVGKFYHGAAPEYSFLLSVTLLQVDKCRRSFAFDIAAIKSYMVGSGEPMASIRPLSASVAEVEEIVGRINKVVFVCLCADGGD